MIKKGGPGGSSWEGHAAEDRPSEKNATKKYPFTPKKNAVHKPLIESDAIFLEFLAEFLKQIVGVRVFEHVTKNILLAVTVTLAKRYTTGVIAGAFLRIDQDPISLADLLELLLSPGISWITVRVISKSQLSVGLFDLFVGGPAANA